MKTKTETVAILRNHEFYYIHYTENNQQRVKVMSQSLIKD